MRLSLGMGALAQNNVPYKILLDARLLIIFRCVCILVNQLHVPEFWEADSHAGTPCSINSSPVAESDEGLRFRIGFEVDFLGK